MSFFQRINRLDLTAGTALAALTLIIGGVITYSSWLGILVTLHTANPIDAISPYETLTLTFSQPMRPNDAENQLQLQPATAGKLEWQDDRTARFIPSQPFQGKLTVHMVPGRLGVDGSWLRKDVSWQLTIRQPLIVYLNYGEPQRELMTVPASGGIPQQLTFTDKNVYDFDVSPSGDQVAYSVLNAQKGIDLWVVDRDGKDAHKLMDCGFGRCTYPAWSPDGKLLAYNMEAAPITPNGLLGVPRPRLFDLASGEDRPVFSDNQIVGYGVLWSPDGNWLASCDGVDSQIRVVNLKTGQQVTLPSNYGEPGSWSPDSRYLLYANVVTGSDNIPKTFLYRADFQSGEIGVFLGKASDPNDYAYDVPAWSPTGNQIVVGMRANPPKPERELWVISPDLLGGPVIAKEPNHTYDFYEWDPWGTSLLIQQADLSKPYYPEAAVWTPLQGLRVVAGNAMFPHWLP